MSNWAVRLSRHLDGTNEVVCYNLSTERSLAAASRSHRISLGVLTASKMCRLCVLGLGQMILKFMT